MLRPSKKVSLFVSTTFCSQSQTSYQPIKKNLGSHFILQPITNELPANQKKLGFSLHSADTLFSYTMLAAYPYTYPHLLKDADQFVAHVSQAEHAKSLEQQLHQQVRETRLTAIDFDLRTGPHSADDLQTVTCSVYPAALITPGSPVFDVLLQCDHLFKHIYRYIVQVAFLDKLTVESYIFATQLDSQKRLQVEPTAKRAGFTALKNEVTLFKLRHRDQLQQWRDNHHKYKGQEFCAQLVFDRVDFDTTDTHISFYTLQPTVRTAWMDRTPLPPDHPAAVLQLFVAEHYPAIKRAFPVYQHLETVFCLCALNVISGKQHEDAMPLTVVGEYVDGIYHVGGVKMQPQPTRVTTEEARVKARADPCRKAFDIGGFACAFMPALMIQDCLAANEQDFLRCLELPNK
jgi:hypothetical protein